jgi:hypothetical protein
LSILVEAITQHLPVTFNSYTSQGFVEMHIRSRSSQTINFAFVKIMRTPTRSSNRVPVRTMPQTPYIPTRGSQALIATHAPHACMHRVLGRTFEAPEPCKTAVRPSADLPKDPGVCCFPRYMTRPALDNCLHILNTMFLTWMYIYPFRGSSLHVHYLVPCILLLVPAQASALNG